MELTPKQQTIDLLAKANQVLVTTHQQPDGDAIGSLLALKMVLEKIGKRVTAVCPSPLPAVFKFLPQIESIGQSIEGSPDILITIDTTNLVVEKLGYRPDPEHHQLHLVITPKTGSINRRDLTVGRTTPAFGAIIVLDTPDIERLGDLYDRQANLFYETPIINLDHHASNEQFGTINWIDLVATSTAEVLVALIESLTAKSQSWSTPNRPLLDSDVATCLLTGLITDTSSFQNINTTPKSLTVAAQLVAAGARQQEIVHHIYKTKPLSTLKLWGAVLAKIKDELEGGFIWTVATKADFDQAQAAESELAGLVDELLKTTQDRQFVVIFSQRGDRLHGSLRSINQNLDVGSLATALGGGGHPQAAAFEVPITNTNNLDTTVEAMVTKIKQIHRAKSFTATA